MVVNTFPEKNQKSFCRSFSLPPERYLHIISRFLLKNPYKYGIILSNNISAPTFGTEADMRFYYFFMKFVRSFGVGFFSALCVIIFIAAIAFAFLAPYFIA